MVPKRILTIRGKKKMPLFEKSRGITLNIPNIMAILLMVFVLIQGVGLILEQFIDVNIKLGPFFLLIVIAIIVMMGFVTYKKLNEGTGIGKEDIIPLILIMSISIFVLMMLRTYLPEIFANNIQSIVALGWS